MLNRVTNIAVERRWFGWQKRITLYEYERGLLYRRGQFVKLLPPGQYTFWRWEPVEVIRVSTRQMSHVITGQEMLTSDSIELRLSLVAQFSIENTALAIHVVEDYTLQLHQDLQLALRAAVSAHDLDSLLKMRHELGEVIKSEVAPQAAQYGLSLHRVGVRDIILPGYVRTVMIQEVEADRAGRAELIKARHEVAAARARANVAKVLQENPQAARLHELEMLVELASKSAHVYLAPDVSELLRFKALEQG